MRDWLSTPISDADPCGPDLERENDDAFLDYYYEAESRLPERYFTPGMSGVGRDGREGAADQLFDPDSIDLARETATITELLKRSRDLRLLGLLARFQILAGKLELFADSITAIRELLEAWPGQVNPDLTEGRMERRNALDSLTVQATVVAPLQHFPLLVEGDFTFRSYQVATGEATKRQSETEHEVSEIISALRNPRHAAEVAGVHNLLTRISDDMQKIAELAASETAGGLTLDLSAPLGVIGEMQGLIAQARPDLQRAGDVQPPAEPRSDAQPDVLQPDVPVSAVPLASDIANRAEAEARLKAAEDWLAQTEPSSPALLLVVQARQLIGKTLVEALDALMPQEAARAVIAFPPDTGFALSMEKLRQLAEATGKSTAQASQGLEGNPDIATPLIRDRTGLSNELGLIEGWFHNAEPASPIPVLLSRARSFLNRGFESILTELMPPKV